jgi:hypothetical protein
MRMAADLAIKLLVERELTDHQPCLPQVARGQTVSAQQGGYTYTSLCEVPRGYLASLLVGCDQ